MCIGGAAAAVGRLLVVMLFEMHLMLDDDTDELNTSFYTSTNDSGQHAPHFPQHRSQGKIGMTRPIF